jgi:hypothetical protein
MKQLAGGKHMKNDCFPRTLKFEIKIKLFSLECKDAEVDFIGRIDAVDSKQYNFLRLQLEEFGVINWPFNFWDVEASAG